MKVTVLGSACPASHFIASKDANVWPSAFLVEWASGEHLLLECSQSVQQRLEQMGHDYSKIKHIAISHVHPDHAAPIHFIQSVYVKGKFGGEKFVNPQINLYGPNQLMSDIPKLWKIYLPERNGELFEFAIPVLHPMTIKNRSQIGSATLISQKAYHGFGRCDALGYRLETAEGTVAYSGDTGLCEGVYKISENADIFFCEAGGRIGDKRIAKEYGHLAPFDVGQIAAKSNPKKLVLYHYTGLDNDDEMIKEVKRAGYSGEVTAAKDFEIINL